MIPTHELGADYSGEGYRHHQSGEIIVLGNEDADRIFMPENGSFYLDSLIVKDVNTDRVLSIGVDYMVYGFDREASEASGRDVRGIIHIVNSGVSQVSIDYQFVGGIHGTGYNLLRNSIVNGVSIGKMLVDWHDIMEKPSNFDPAFHRHHINDTIKLEALIIVINKIRDAVVASRNVRSVQRDFFTRLENLYNTMYVDIERIKTEKKKDAETKLNALKQVGGEYIFTDNPADPATYKNYGNWMKIDGVVLTPVNDNDDRIRRYGYMLPKGGAGALLRNTHIYRRIPDGVDNLKYAKIIYSGGSYLPGHSFSFIITSNATITDLRYALYDADGNDVTSRFIIERGTINVENRVNVSVRVTLPNDYRYMPGKYSLRLVGVESAPIYFELLEPTSPLEYIPDPVTVKFSREDGGDVVYEYDGFYPLYAVIEIDSLDGKSIKRLEVNGQTFTVPSTHVLKNKQYFNITGLAHNHTSHIVDCKAYDSSDNMIGWGSVSKSIDLQPYEIICRKHGTDEVVTSLDEGSRYTFHLKVRDSNIIFWWDPEYVECTSTDFTFHRHHYRDSRGTVTAEAGVEVLLLDITVKENFKTDLPNKAFILRSIVETHLSNQTAHLDNTRVNIYPINDTSKVPIITAYLASDSSGLTKLTTLDVYDRLAPVFLIVDVQNYSPNMEVIGFNFKKVSGANDFNVNTLITSVASKYVNGVLYNHVGVTGQRSVIPLNRSSGRAVMGTLPRVELEIIYDNVFKPTGQVIDLVSKLPINQYGFTPPRSSSIITSITEATIDSSGVIHPAQFALQFHISSLVVLDNDEELTVEWSENAYQFIRSTRPDGRLRTKIRLAPASERDNVDRDFIPISHTSSVYAVNELLTCIVTDEARGSNTITAVLKDKRNEVLGTASITVHDNKYDGRMFLTLHDYNSGSVIPDGTKLSRTRKYYLQVNTSKPEERPFITKMVNLINSEPASRYGLSFNPVNNNDSKPYGVIHDTRYQGLGEVTANFELTVRDLHSTTSATDKVITQTLTKELTFLSDNYRISAGRPSASLNHFTSDYRMQLKPDLLGGAMRIHAYQLPWETVLVAKIEYNNAVGLTFNGNKTPLLNQYFAIYRNVDENLSERTIEFPFTAENIRKKYNEIGIGKITVGVYHAIDVVGSIPVGESITPITLKAKAVPLDTNSFNFQVTPFFNHTDVAIASRSTNQYFFENRETATHVIDVSHLTEDDRVDLVFSEDDYLEATLVSNVATPNREGYRTLTYNVTPKALPDGTYKDFNSSYVVKLHGGDGPEHTLTYSGRGFSVRLPRITSSIDRYLTLRGVVQTTAYVYEGETTLFHVGVDVPKQGMHDVEVRLKGAGLEKVFGITDELIVDRAISNNNPFYGTSVNRQSIGISLTPVANELINARGHNEFMLEVVLRATRTSGGKGDITDTLHIPVVVEDRSKKPNLIVTVPNNSSSRDDIGVSLINMSSKRRDVIVEVYGTDNRDVNADTDVRFLIGRSSLTHLSSMHEVKNFAINYASRRYTARHVGHTYYFYVVVKGVYRTDSDEFGVIHEHKFPYRVDQANASELAISSTESYWWDESDTSNIRASNTTIDTPLKGEPDLVRYLSNNIHFNTDTPEQPSEEVRNKYLNEGLDEVALVRATELRDILVDTGEKKLVFIETRGSQEDGYQHTYILRRKFLIKPAY